MTPDEARALIADGRKHDQAMTDGPWKAIRDFDYVSVGPFQIKDNNEGPENDYDGITWIRTNLASLLTGYASALDEVDAKSQRISELLQTIVRLTNETPFPDEIAGWQGQRAKLVAEVGTLRAMNDAGSRAVEALEGIEQRTGAELLTLRTELGELKLVLEQQDRDAERMRAELTELHADSERWLTEANLERPNLRAAENRIRLILKGAPCTSVTKT